MSRRKISQDQARIYKARAERAEGRINELVAKGTMNWHGTDIAGDLNLHSHTLLRLRTAKTLGYAIFLDIKYDTEVVRFRAIKVES